MRPRHARLWAGPFSASKGFGANFLLQLSPNANPGTFPLACVRNAASYGIGPIAPGGILALFGNGLGPQQGIQMQATPQSPFPTQAANVQVTFDGTPAPLLWVQDTQINVIAPWSLTPGQTTQVCASYNGVKAKCLNWPVAQTSPGVFTVDGSHAAALNQDGTVNSAANPAARGSIVSVFATGLGPITPPQSDGTLVGVPLPANDLMVYGYAHSMIFSILNSRFVPASRILELTYKGPAPYLVAGTSQINFKVTEDPGGFWITVLSAQSQTFAVYVAGQ